MISERHLSGYASQNYAEHSHFDTFNNSATMGLRCSHSIPERPYRYCFLYPTVSYGNREGIIVTQPLGTLTSWFANRCKYTSSVDSVEFYNRVDENSHVPSIDVVAAQARKILSMSSKHQMEFQHLIYWPAF